MLVTWCCREEPFAEPVRGQTLFPVPASSHLPLRTDGRLHPLRTTWQLRKRHSEVIWSHYSNSGSQIWGLCSSAVAMPLDAESMGDMASENAVTPNRVETGHPGRFPGGERPVQSNMDRIEINQG